MSRNNTIFNQLLHLIPRHDFEKLMKSHCGDRYVKGFTCWGQMIALMYEQIQKWGQVNRPANG